MAKTNDIARQSGTASGKAGLRDGSEQHQVPKDKAREKDALDGKIAHSQGGDRERHGSGEGVTGMQPGAGHPRGR